MPAAKIYIYDKDTEILGFISLINKTHIGALFIDTGYQGTGIGTLLLNFVKAVYPVLSLSVYRKNYKALSFYKKAGFIIASASPNSETGEMEYYMKWQNS